MPMKRPPLVLLVAALAAACGKSNSPNATPSDAPPTTPVGVPKGGAVEKVIGPAGGALSSADGALTVSVPAGAVSGPLSFSIQPLTNEAFGGVGDAYALGPEGTALAAPVTLSFKLPAGETGAYGIAFQDEQHRWQLVDGISADETGAVVSAPVAHFSHWSVVRGVQLQPLSARVQPRGTVQLSVVTCVQLTEGADAAAQAIHRFVFKCVPGSFDVVSGSWTVNGIPGGNGMLGKLAGTTAGATYTAPSEPPEPPTVRVSAQAANGTLPPLVFAGAPAHGKGLLFSEITVGCGADDDPCGLRCTTVKVPDMPNDTCLVSEWVPDAPEGFLKNGGTFSSSLSVGYRTISFDSAACRMTLTPSADAFCGSSVSCTLPAVFDLNAGECQLSGCDPSGACVAVPCAFQSSPVCSLVSLERIDRFSR